MNNQFETPLDHFEPRIEKFAAQSSGADPAHDLLHVRRVVSWVRRIALAEGADLWVVVPAAWLHDCLSVPKNSPDRVKASWLSAERATQFLREMKFPGQYLSAIHHAIHAHSFSAQVEPKSLEAKVVQDADRLDAIGAIGIARCMMLGGSMGRALYSESDPFCHEREPDDTKYSLDHFPAKLLRLVETFHTKTANAEAQRRDLFLKGYLQQLEHELR